MRISFTLSARASGLSSSELLEGTSLDIPRFTAFAALGKRFLSGNFAGIQRMFFLRSSALSSMNAAASPSFSAETITSFTISRMFLSSVVGSSAGTTHIACGTIFFIDCRLW